jgi:2-phospho-L-lactate/phosphoenolpyruvate guanylyltransferase
MNAVAILLKPPTLGKTRLSPYLSDMMREGLIYSMLKDVIAAASGARFVDEVILVTKDMGAIYEGRKLGASIYDEGDLRGINAAVDALALECGRRGHQQLLILPADIPLITAEDIEHIYGVTGLNHVMVVPSADGSGTNALYMSPPGIIFPSFGAGSYQKHLNNARQANVAFSTRVYERIALDVDLPEDLWNVAAKGIGTHTTQFIETYRLLKTLTRT